VFEILTAVVMKSFIFWDIPPCSLVKLTAFFKQVGLLFSAENGGDVFLGNSG
jgi:hypothetical protein